MLQRLLRSEVEESVQQVVAKLPPELRMVVILRYTEELSYDQIAEILGCPPGTVASRLNRAHKLLERRLAVCGILARESCLKTYLVRTLLTRGTCGACGAPPKLWDRVQLPRTPRPSAAALRFGVGLRRSVSSVGRRPLHAFLKSPLQAVQARPAWMSVPLCQAACHLLPRRR